VLDARLAANLLAGQGLPLQIRVLQIVLREQRGRVLQFETLLPAEILEFEVARLIQIIDQGIQSMQIVGAEHEIVREGVRIRLRVDDRADALLLSVLS